MLSVADSGGFGNFCGGFYMKKMIISVAAFAAIAASGFAGCGSCGGCGSSCPGHYYPGQTFCTGGSGFGLNLFGGCNSCAQPPCNTCGGAGYGYAGGYNGGYMGANVGPVGAGISY
jgi:hypothetical protein